MSKFKKLKRFSLDSAVENSKFDIVKNLKWFLIAPIVLVLIGVVLLCTVGFNLGIDFTGGSIVTINVNEQVEDVDKQLGEYENKVNNVLKGHGLFVSTIQKSILDSDGDIVVQVKYQNAKGATSKQVEETNADIRLELLKEFDFVKADVDLDDVDEDTQNLVKIGGVTTASASAELMMKSFIALLVAIVIILVYVAFRFEVTSGLAAILALFHDVLVTSAVMLICRVQINVAFIAALITILGYSINNTIIIFDRMREEVRMAQNADRKIVNNNIANIAVKGTMLRSILTTLTTFIMIFFITVIGVADIREFAFPIMVGILAGFYSSVFITPGLWAIAYRPRKKKRFFEKKKTDKPAELADDIVETEA